jgi:hypothetical protein
MAHDHGPLTSPDAESPAAEECPHVLVDLPCGCQDVHYACGYVDREHDHVACDGVPLDPETAEAVTARLHANPGYQAALADAETESWDGPGIDATAMIEAAGERRALKVSDLRTAAEIHEEDMGDVDYRAEYERTKDDGDASEQPQSVSAKICHAGDPCYLDQAAFCPFAAGPCTSGCPSNRYRACIDSL